MKKSTDPNSDAFELAIHTDGAFFKAVLTLQSRPKEPRVLSILACEVRRQQPEVYEEWVQMLSRFLTRMIEKSGCQLTDLKDVDLSKVN